MKLCSTLLVLHCFQQVANIGHLTQFLIEMLANSESDRAPCFCTLIFKVWPPQLLSFNPWWVLILDGNCIDKGIWKWAGSVGSVLWDYDIVIIASHPSPQSETSDDKLLHTRTQRGVICLVTASIGWVGDSSHFLSWSWMPVVDLVCPFCDGIFRKILVPPQGRSTYITTQQWDSYSGPN